jgi:hypothetical protein
LAGKVEISAGNDLGTAIVAFGSTGNTVSLVLMGAVTLDSPLILLNGGIVTVTGTLIVELFGNQTPAMLTASTELDPLFGANVELDAGTSGAFTLTVGGHGDVELGTQLNATTVNVVPDGTVTLLKGLLEENGATVNKKGGTIIVQH